MNAGKSSAADAAGGEFSVIAGQGGSKGGNVAIAAGSGEANGGTVSVSAQVLQAPVAL